MRIIIVVAFALVALVTRGQYSFTSGFSPGQRPLLDESVEVNGTWHEDVLQHASGFQVVGSLGLADGTGSARSATFLPVDLTRGQGSFGDFTHMETVPNPSHDPDLPVGPFNPPPTMEVEVTDSYHASIRLRFGRGVNETSLRLTLYDDSEGSSSWVPAMPPTVGGFVWREASETDFAGNLDWTRVNRFGLAGLGGTGEEQFALDSLTVSAVPEPGAVGVVVALGLVGLVVWRRARAQRDPLCP